MANIVVLGGGIGGLTTAMLLAKDGHVVTVLERDDAPPPGDLDDIWSDWERRGVNQFRLLHFFVPRFMRLLEAELPAVVDALDDAGALRFNVMALVPEDLTGGFQASDDAFESLTGRRPVVEAALARVAAATPGLKVRRGVSVVGLMGTREGDRAPHVTGVRTEDGSEVGADLVVDAMGRRSVLPRWIQELGAKPPIEEVEDSGFVYYGRHFRSADGSTPALFGGLLGDYGSVSILTLPADNGTWGVGVIASAKDAPMRGLKDNETWMRTVKEFPLVAHWTEGEPLDDVAVMAKIEDRYRRYVVDDAPVVTGVVAVADSWACTNPSLGRGATIGLMHAVELRDHLRRTPLDDPSAFAIAWDAATEATVGPWYRATLQYDHHRLAEAEAAARGEDYDPGDIAWDLTRALQHSAGSDPELFRGLMSIVSVLTLPDEVMGRPGFMDKVIEHGSDWRSAEIVGPGRAELEALVKA